MTQIIILAAGKGTRMNSDLPKVLVPLNGRPLINYLAQAVVGAQVKLAPIIVVSHENKTLIKSALSQYNFKYAIQEQQLGTGHAVASAKNLVPSEAKNVLILYGDHPFINSESIKKFINLEPKALAIFPVKLADFTEWRQNFYHWGRIIRNTEGKIKEIIEFKDANEVEKNIKELNPGFMCFNKEWLFANIDKLENKNKAGEFYLTDLVKIAEKSNYDIESLEIPAKEAIGINSQVELEAAKEVI